MSTTRDCDVRTLLLHHLKQLDHHIRAMLEPTQPKTPLPRPRLFVLLPGTVVWPFTTRREVWWLNVRVRESRWDRMYVTDTSLADVLITKTRERPRAILRVLRRIQAATAWCQARRAGRERAANEIRRQQAPGREALEAEIVLLTLGQTYRDHGGSD